MTTLIMMTSSGRKFCRTPTGSLGFIHLGVQCTTSFLLEWYNPYVDPKCYASKPTFPTLNLKP